MFVCYLNRILTTTKHELLQTRPSKEEAFFAISTIAIVFASIIDKTTVNCSPAFSQMIALEKVKTYFIRDLFQTTFPI